MGVKIRQKDGKWYVFINHQGKRKAKCVGDSKRAAEEVKRKLEARLTLGDIGILNETPPPVSFAEYAQQWLERYVAVECKVSSRRILRALVHNHLLPVFGGTPLQDITRAQVKGFLLQKKQRYSPSYTKDIIGVLHAIYEHAIEEELLERNPAAKLGKYLQEKRVDPAHEMMPFTSGELVRYLTAMRTRYPQYYVYFLCLARTGMREGEALGLFWEDLQFGQAPHETHRYIQVRRTYDPITRAFSTPKNGKSRRVDMSQELQAAFLELRNQRFDAAVLKGMTTLPPVIFVGREGLPVAPSWLSRVHKQVCVLAGLRANRIHDLRHSYATIQLYEHHAPSQYVSEQLGHASIRMTVDTYGHPQYGATSAFADRLDRPDVRQKATPAQLHGALRSK
jgi:integrase